MENNSKINDVIARHSVKGLSGDEREVAYYAAMEALRLKERRYRKLMTRFVKFLSKRTPENYRTAVADFFWNKEL